MPIRKWIKSFAVNTRYLEWDLDYFFVSPYHVWSIDVTRTKKERIEISLLLTFANFCHKILHLGFLDLWLRMACPLQCKGEVWQGKQNWSTLNCCRSFTCTCLVNSTIMFIFKVVLLIFFVLAKYESKNMWSKFDKVTSAYRTW